MSTYPQQPQQTEQYGAQTGEPPLWAPYYGAPIGAAVKRFFKKYADFSGRASRSEYWWWTLVSAIVTTILNTLATVVGSAGATVSDSGTVTLGGGAIAFYVILGIWGLATLVPSLALLVRRLHDGNFTGWLALLVLVPFLGVLAVFVLSLLPSNPAGQRFDKPTAA